MCERSRSDLARVLAQPERFGVVVRDGQLHIEEVALTELATRVGTPLYVYGAGYVERRYRELVAALSGRTTRICYAVKANSSQAILRHLARLGAGADIVSGGELERVLAAGFRPGDVVFSGVGKRDEEIDAAIVAGVRSINIESAEELERVALRAAAMGRPAAVSLRINPDVDPETHPYLATGLRKSKFGIPMEEGFDLAMRTRALTGVRLVGLACHIGSQITESSPFVDSIARVRHLYARLVANGFELRQLDVGGGLGVAYGGDDREMNVFEWGEAILRATADLPLELVIEPGRWLVAHAGVLLTRVIGRKRTSDKEFVIVDAAMNDLLRPALYDAYHAIVPVELPQTTTEERMVDVVGPVCESGDFLARDRRLPVVARGELVAVLGAGAYGASMASTYNTRPIAAEVFVCGERWDIIRARRSTADLIGDERYASWQS